MEQNNRSQSNNNRSNNNRRRNSSNNKPSDTNSGNNNSSSNSNKKRRFSKGRRPSGNQQSGNSNAKRSNRNRYASKLTSIQAIFSKYDNLLENYLNLRAKYFDYYFKDNSKQREKVIKNYQSALEQLRTFTKQLSDYQKQQLESRNFFKLDTTYSQNRNVDPELTEVTITGEERDVHLTKQQLERESFKDEQEESVGTIDDYNSYKGI